MKQIQLNKFRGKQGFFTLVDDEDFEWLNKWNWSILHREHTNYCQNKNHNKMHRLIMKAEKGQMIDHIDGNGLNNQKNNLRFCTYSQNMSNKKSCGTSKYLGVSLSIRTRNRFSKRENKIKTHFYYYWLAQITHNKKVIYLGIFKTETEAAIAYNKAALKYHGKFTKLNII